MAEGVAVQHVNHGTCGMQKDQLSHRRGSNQVLNSFEEGKKSSWDRAPGWLGR